MVSQGIGTRSADRSVQTFVREAVPRNERKISSLFLKTSVGSMEAVLARINCKAAIIRGIVFESTGSEGVIDND